MSDDRRRLAADYQRRLRRLALSLYEHDPYTMGSSISAPDDEYLSIAEHLLPLLSKAAGRDECARILRERNMAGAGLLDDVWEIVHG